MSKDIRLTNLQRQDLANAISNTTHPLSAFSLLQLTRQEYNGFQSGTFTTTKCVHTDSGHYFIFGGLWNEYSPHPLGRTTEQAVSDWSTTLNDVNIWLLSLRKELETPNPWEHLTSSQTLVDYFSQSLDDIFQPQEQHVIANAVESAKQTASEANNLPAEQLKRIADALDDLKASSTNVTKKQFLTLVIGELAKLAIQKIDMHVIHSIWDTLMHGMQTIYRYIPLLGN
jgi:hypothetical protein